MRDHQPTQTDRRLPDRGTSLIELLIAILLVGTAGIAVITTFTVSIRGSDTHRDLADSQALVASAGDVLADVPPDASDDYLSCATTSTTDIVNGYQAIVDAIPGVASVTVTSIEYWDSTAAGTGAFGTTCRYALGDRLQRITLAATADDVTSTLAVVKRPATDQTTNTLAPPTTLGGGNVVPEPNPLLGP